MKRSRYATCYFLGSSLAWPALDSISHGGKAFSIGISVLGVLGIFLEMPGSIGPTG